MTDAFVCVRVSELREPYVPSERGECSRCGARVWIDRELLTLAQRTRVLCVQCAGESTSWGR